jgi:DNA-binding response OmpR family regulator
MVRVLVAEDHVKMAEAVAFGLRREGMAVDVALDGRQALDRASVTGYDVIVLDRDLPEVHGDEVCRRLVAGGHNGRILMLTAAGAIEDRVDGLGLGADDYLPKPFAFAELVARVRVLARRSRPPLPPLLVRGDLRLDPAHRVATRSGRRLELTVKEFAVLQLLLEAQGAVVPAEELLEKAWDEMADPFSTTVKSTVHRLRAKLGDPPVIHTIPQAGYRV